LHRVEQHLGMQLGQERRSCPGPPDRVGGSISAGNVAVNIGTRTRRRR
jgi:hypothetical protein